MIIDNLLFLAAGFLVGVAATFVFNWLVLRTASSIYMREKGARGNAARDQNQERLAAAVAEGMALHKEGKKPGEILTVLGPKYPDVALQLFRKFSKGDLGGLI